jgi:hypothetical protein
MPLTKLLHDLDKLTPDEKLQAIQYLTTSLIQKRSQEPLSAPTRPSLSLAEAPKSQPSINEQLVSNSEAYQPNSSEKKSGKQKKPYVAEKVSEMSPDGKLFEVEIPGWQMVQDVVQEACEHFAEQENDPSLATYETVSGLANLIRVIAQIQAKAIIRKKITGSEYPEKPPVETKRSKRKKVDRPEQKMTFVRVDDHWHIEYSDLPESMENG